MYRRHAALLTLLLLAALICGTGLWLRAQRRQYALNRALIAALVKWDDKRALALVNAGADPNTLLRATPLPSLAQFINQWFHRSKPLVIGNPTALSMACGGSYFYEADHKKETYVVYGWAWPQSRLSDIAVVQAMLEHGADVNVKDILGRTPLTLAVHMRSANMVRLLLDHGADANTPDGMHNLALYEAVGTYTDWGIVRLLLEHGANPNIADHGNVTPLMQAQRSKSSDLIALLKHYGARK